MLVSIPDANQTFREITFDVISKRIETDIQPAGVLSRISRAGCCTRATSRTRAARAGRTCWSPETDEAAGTQTIYLARRGRMVINRAEREVHLVLEDGNQYSIAKDRAGRHVPVSRRRWSWR